MNNEKNRIIENLDNLCKRLQDDYNNIISFKQYEEDRVVLNNTIEILETLTSYIEYERNTYPINCTLNKFLNILQGKYIGMKWKEIVKE